MMMDFTLTADEFLAVFRDDPLRLPQAPDPASVADIDFRRTAEGWPCVRCGAESHVAYVALTSFGNRWMDLCETCAQWLRFNMPEEYAVPGGPGTS